MKRRELRFGLRLWKLAALAVVVVASMMLVIGCGGSEENDTATGEDGSGLTVVRATVAPGVGSLPYRIAIDKGFFKKQGIEVETTEGYEPSAYISALDRQFDVTMMVTPDVVQAASAGRKIKAFAGMEAISPEKLTDPVVTMDPDIQSVEDLLGKKLAVLELGGTTQAMFNYVLEDKGLDSSEIDYVVVPFQNQEDQLRAGRVDAIFGAVGFFESTLANGGHVAAKMPDEALALAGAQFPVAYPMFISSEKYAEENPEVLSRFRAAIEEAVEWINAHQAEALDEFAAWVGRDPETVKDIEIPPAFWKTDIGAGDFAPWLPVLESYDLLKEPVDPDDLVAQSP